MLWLRTEHTSVSGLDVGVLKLIVEAYLLLTRVERYDAFAVCFARDSVIAVALDQRFFLLPVFDTTLFVRLRGLVSALLLE